MSGFEIAGVVLGSIPLIVSTLENYKTGVRTIQRWRRYGKELQSLIRNLETERAKLQNVCEKLLDGVVRPSQIDSMVGDPYGPLWLEESIQKEIRVRLWRDWDAFERTLKDIQESIKEIEERLEVGANVQWTDRSLAAKELKRVSFSLSRSTYADLLNTVKDGVSSLETLATMNIELEPQRRMRSRVKLLNILRNLYSSIYRAVSSSLACACEHSIYMRLSNLTEGITPVDEEDDVIRSLDVYLAVSSNRSLSDGSDEAGGQWQICEEIAVQAVPPVHQRNKPGMLLPKITEPKQSKKAVKFSLSRFTSYSSTPTIDPMEMSAVTNITAKMSLQAPMTALPEVQSGFNLCVELNKPLGKRRECLGPIADPTCPEARSYTVSCLSTSSSEGIQWRMISLQEILGNRRAARNMLTYKQRLQLAVFISTSVLQHYETPWMPHILNNRNIFFLQAGGLPFYEKAFLAAERDMPSAGVPKPPPIIRNPTLLALGIILIELIRGETIDSLRTPEEVMGAEFRHISDYMTAQRLLGEIYQTSSNYGSAVRRCINGEFQRQTLNLDDEDFRHEVYCGVVALLQEDLNNL